MKQPGFISIVCRLHNDARHLPELIRRLTEVIGSRYENFEVILVDDGSTDSTASVLRSLCKSTASLRIIRLSRKFGMDVAFTGGLEASIGDFIVTLLPYGDPIENLPACIEVVRREGVVISGRDAQMRTQDGPLSRFAHKAFTHVTNRWLDLPYRPDRTFFHVMSRQALNAVLQIRDRGRFIRTLADQTGFLIRPYEYERPRLNPKSFGWARKIDQAITLVVLHSTRPLRFVTWFGLSCALLNLVYLAYVLAIALFKTRIAEGWITLSVTHSAMFLGLFVILSVCSEYLGLLLVESRDRPLYYVREEYSSDAPASLLERRNVLSHAVDFDIH